MALHLPADDDHVLVRSYPTSDAVAHLFDEQDVQRAIAAFQLFYPTVSLEAVLYGLRDAGLVDNMHMAVFSPRPHHSLLTVNSDTAYGIAALDLRRVGPMVIEMPRGAFAGAIIDHHQRFVLEPAAGSVHLLLPPDHAGPVPEGYVTARSPTFINMLAVRALDPDGPGAGVAALSRVKLYPLADPGAVVEILDVTERALECSIVRWENDVELWNRLHHVLATEPLELEQRAMLGLLAAVGIDRDRPFVPNLRLLNILAVAARFGLDQMRVEAFASQRPDRIVWRRRSWEWPGLITDDASFETSGHLDLQARDRWFFQAAMPAPALFRRGGTLELFTARDTTGAFLDGSQRYELSLPLPVPASAWSVSVYDARTRALVRTRQGRAVVGTWHERLDAEGEQLICLGPLAPSVPCAWIQTPENTGVFVYLRLYGAGAAALADWKLADFIAR